MTFTTTATAPQHPSLADGYSPETLIADVDSELAELEQRRAELMAERMSLQTQLTDKA